MLVKPETIKRWKAQREAADLIREAFPTTDHRERKLRRRQNRAKRKKEKRAAYLEQLNEKYAEIDALVAELPLILVDTR